MIKKELYLTSGQYIADLGVDVGAGITLLESGTGTGKTTWILEELIKRHKVIMVVPLVTQAYQLVQKYKSRNDIVVLYGPQKGRSGESLEGKNIVCTYDLLPWARSHMSDESEYLFVVDEVHKLYSAGGYRDEAINPILRAIRKKSNFKAKLLVTATYTEMMGKLAKLEPDSRFVVRMEAPIVRSIEVRAYKSSDRLNWLDHVLERLKGRKNQKGIVFVRLNSMARIEKAKRLLAKLGFKSMIICRATSQYEDVKEALRNEELPQNIDVVFATSIMDEAIDLRNKSGEVDSVHIVDRTAHPEEIIQFIGRLRESNPPIFLHLNPESDFFEADQPAKAGSSFTRSEVAHSYLQKVASSALDFVREYRKTGSGSSVKSFVGELNATFSRFTNGNILQLSGGADKPFVSINDAGILASCYRIDLSAAYATFITLKARLNALLPSASVTLIVIDKLDLSRLTDDMCNVEDDYLDEVTIANAAAGKRLVDDYLGSSHECMKDFADKIFENAEDGSFMKIPYNKKVDPLHHEGYFLGLKLAQVLVKEEDVEAALVSKRARSVLAVHAGFDDALENGIREVVAEMFSSDDLWGERADPSDAAGIVLDAAQRAIKKFPILKDAICDERNYAKLLYLDKSGKLQAKQTKAMNLLASILNCEDVNSHKPEKRYLIINGLSWGDYRYHRLSPLLPSEKRKIICPDMEAAFADDELVA